MQKKLGGPAQLKALAERLEQSKTVKQFDKPGEPQAWTLVHALSDMEESMISVLCEHLPALMEANDAESAEDALHDVGEALRHILYHLNDVSFFGYLKDD